MQLELQLVPGGTTFRELNGSLDDIRIYNRPLTDSDINSLYNWAELVHAKELRAKFQSLVAIQIQRYSAIEYSQAAPKVVNFLFTIHLGNQS